ncbi:MAG TPA: uracil-DNA glycosylase [Gallionella sp.]
MDRREAMLRELNLYPLWVRREPVAQEEIVEAVTIEHELVGHAQLAFDGTTDETISNSTRLPVEKLLTGLTEEGNQTAGHRLPADDLLALHPKDDVQVAGFAQQAGEDSLREFQLKNAGGALGRLGWPELKQKVHDCELCKLRAGCMQTVFGVGDEQADWLFIGEAPGEEEDVSGEPFVGHAGRLLDNMLMAIKQKRGDNVYIANVIKCRPEDDRQPHVGEIATCLPYLKRQIELIKPKLIVALGRTAASALLGTDATIASLRGMVHEYKGIPLIVTFHPAYLLRSPMEKAKAWQDLCLAVATMNNQSE